MDRLTDPVACREVTDKYPDYFTFPVEDWLCNESNIALQEGENIAFAEDKGCGNYWVHFCFHTARGREAIDLTRRMLFEFFAMSPAKTAIGLIAVENKKAKWLIRQAGFTSLGTVTTSHAGPCEMFYFNKDDLNGLL